MKGLTPKLVCSLGGGGGVASGEGHPWDFCVFEGGLGGAHMFVVVYSFDDP